MPGGRTREGRPGAPSDRSQHALEQDLHRLRVARTAGSPAAFVASLGGQRLDLRFSDTWQLVINTGTTIVTFLMVFVIQSSQNRDSEAIQAKLDELIRTSKAQDSYIGIERLTEKELDEIRALSEWHSKSKPAAADEDKASDGED